MRILPPGERPNFLQLTQKFKLLIQPKLTQFIQAQKLVATDDLLFHYREKVYDLIASAKEDLLILPKISLEKLEDALFFVDLYQFRFTKDLVFNTKEQLRRKIQLIQASFQIEAGVKNLKAQNQQLSFTESASDINPFPEPLPLPDLQTESGPLPASNLIISGITFPEESNLAVSRPLSTPIDQNRSQVSCEPPLSETANYIAERSSESVYPFSMWFPTDNVNEFKNLRYSADNGRPLNN